MSAESAWLELERGRASADGKSAHERASVY